MNKRAKGSRQKLKTKKWLEAQGWQCWNSEVGRVAFFGGKLHIVRQDLLGADLVCLNRKDILFVQSKTHKNDMIDGIREFQKLPFPSSVKRWVVRWEKRNPVPIIKDAKERAVENFT